MSKKKKDDNYYVNNKEFSQAVHEYVKQIHNYPDNSPDIPQVPRYIADSFMKIAYGLTYHKNFIRYKYRNDLAMDGVENCLKAIRNYDIDAATRTGNPNAFSYFSKICYFAFLRRIKKEYAEKNGREVYRDNIFYDEIVHVDAHASHNVSHISQQYLDSVRNMMYENQEYDDDEYVDSSRIGAHQSFLLGTKKYGKVIDSDLEEFLEEEVFYENSDSE